MKCWLWLQDLRTKREGISQKVTVSASRIHTALLYPAVVQGCSGGFISLALHCGIQTSIFELEMGSLESEN